MPEYNLVFEKIKTALQKLEKLIAEWKLRLFIDLPEKFLSSFSCDGQTSR
jgi:hypothetical protein